MKDSTNPFTILENQIRDIKRIVLEIKNAPKEDYTIKYYRLKEAGSIIKKSEQTLKNYSKKGWIKIESSGPREKLINHYQIFNPDNTLREFPPQKKV